MTRRALGDPHPEEAAARSALVVRADRTVARAVLAAIKEHWRLVPKATEGSS